MTFKIFVKKWLWRTLILGLFLVFFLSEILEESMFIDGVWYAVIARNIPALPYFSIGIGILVIPALKFLLENFIEKYIWIQRIMSAGSISVITLGIFLIMINFQK